MPEYPDPAFTVRSLGAFEVADTVLAIAAIVGGVDDQGVRRIGDLSKLLQQPPDGAIRVVDGAGIDGSLVFQLAVIVDNSIRCRDRCVRLMKPHIQEERFVGIAMLVQPRDGFVHDQLAGIALQFTDGSAVADKVVWVPVRG